MIADIQGAMRFYIDVFLAVKVQLNFIIRGVYSALKIFLIFI